ncbi:hypothetical protein ACR9EG_13335, partial [Lactococcus lactis]|uniref:hypothetical protein n=1 Tax=Lactococcus lactis TaxID=1358 RepID=UPI003EB7AF1D
MCIDGGTDASVDSRCTAMLAGSSAAVQSSADWATSRGTSVSRILSTAGQVQVQLHSQRQLQSGAK